MRDPVGRLASVVRCRGRDWSRIRTTYTVRVGIGRYALRLAVPMTPETLTVKITVQISS